MIFPDLAELHLLSDPWEVLSNAEIAHDIQDVLFLRKGTITYLTTPAFRVIDAAQFLKDHVPYLEVRYPPVHSLRRLIIL